jgi:hypothetical protein
MPEFRMKPIGVHALQWFKDGDDSRVIPRPAVVRFDRAEQYFYVDHADSDRVSRPTAWLAVDRQSEVAKKNGEALPFAFYEVKSGREVRIAERMDLYDIYAADHGWTTVPRDFGILVQKDEKGHEKRDMVAPSDWILVHHDGTLSVMSADDFAAKYDAV